MCSDAFFPFIHAIRPENTGKGPQHSMDANVRAADTSQFWCFSTLTPVAMEVNGLLEFRDKGDSRGENISHKNAMLHHRPSWPLQNLLMQRFGFPEIAAYD
jgi:hypothetical protein